MAEALIAKSAATGKAIAKRDFALRTNSGPPPFYFLRTSFRRLAFTRRRYGATALRVAARGLLPWPKRSPKRGSLKHRCGLFCGHALRFQDRSRSPGSELSLLQTDDHLSLLVEPREVESYAQGLTAVRRHRGFSLLLFGPRDELSAGQRVYEPRHGSLKPGGVSLYRRHLSRCNSAGMTTASARMPMAIAVPARTTNHPKTIGTYTQPMMISITQWGMP